MAFSAKLASLFVEIVVNSARADSNIRRLQQGLERTKEQAQQAQLQFAKIRAIAATAFVGIYTARFAASLLETFAKSAAEVESKINNIIIAGDMSAETFEEIAAKTFELTKAIKAISVENFQAIQEEAARMGIEGVDNINRFSTAVAKGSIVAESISSANLAKFIGLLIDLYKSGTESAEKYANTLHVLAVNFRTNEEEIVNVASKWAGAAVTAGVLEAELLALSAAAKDSGITSEIAASGFQRLISTLAKQPITVAEAFGFDPAQFQNLSVFDQMFKVLEALNKLDIKEQTRVLDEIGLGSIRVSRALIAVAKNFDKVQMAVRDANNSITNNAKLTEDVALKQTELATKLNEIANAWNEFLFNLGKSEVFATIIEDIKSLVESLNDLLNGVVKLNIALRWNGKDIWRFNNMDRRFGVGPWLQNQQNRRNNNQVPFGRPTPDQPIATGFSVEDLEAQQDLIKATKFLNDAFTNFRIELTENDLAREFKEIENKIVELKNRFIEMGGSLDSALVPKLKAFEGALKTKAIDEFLQKLAEKELMLVMI